MSRRSLPTATEVEVLTQSARRCALCFGLDKDSSEKQGQIAHLDKDRDNHAITNLVFLCLNHHDRYDGTSSQSKGYRKSEVVHYRTRLYESVVKLETRESRFQRESSLADERCQKVLNVIDRFYALKNSLPVIEHGIMARVKAVHDYISAIVDFEMPSIFSDDQYDSMYEGHSKQIKINLSIPDGVYGLGPEGHLDDGWVDRVEHILNLWISGEASYDDCTDLVFELDERYDLDLHWMLFAIPNRELPALGYQLLQNLVYVFGLRSQAEK